MMNINNFLNKNDCLLYQIYKIFQLNLNAYIVRKNKKEIGFVNNAFISIKFHLKDILKISKYTIYSINESKLINSKN